MAAKVQASELQVLPADARAALRRLDFLAVGVILLVTLPWWLSTRGTFIPYDDPAYVTANSAVMSGLNGESIRAVFSHAWVAFWLPVTFLSLMLDVTIWGSGDLDRLAMGMHITNVVLHVGNAVLLYLFLSRAVGGSTTEEARANCFRSLFAVLLFAMHPLRVESVSWITERKDVLAGFFGFLAMLVWLRYVRGGTRGTRAGSYGVVCVCFVLSLLSKPMLVTLPCVLLLLDLWPLGRIQWGASGWMRRAGRLLLEKVPLLSISLGVSILTMVIQRQYGSLVALKSQGVVARMENAAASYALYLRDHVYFQDLSLYYPLRSFSGAEVGIAALVLLAITVGVAVLVRKAPRQGLPALVGWLWFLGMLVPVIGLVQSGEQGRADRFTYFPSIGLGIAVAWVWPWERLRELWQRKAALAVAGGIVLALTVYTTLRVALWNEPLALFLDGIEHTQKNAKLEYFVGEMLEHYQRPEEAITYYRRAVFDSEGFGQAYLALGRLLVQQGQEEEGFAALDAARKLRPDDPECERTYQRMRELAAQRAATRAK